MNPVNPECAEGKHRNCDETALDLATDLMVSCSCDCHDDGGDGWAL